MYLFILEDGTLVQSKTCKEEDKQAADDGLVNIIRYENDRYEDYYEGEWVEI